MVLIAAASWTEQRLILNPGCLRGGTDCPQGEDEPWLGIITELQSWEMCIFKAEDFKRWSLTAVAVKKKLLGYGLGLC